LDRHATCDGLRRSDYCLRRWDKLCMFLQYGEMDPDTNEIERLIRTFVIGRGNWVLHKSQAGAPRAPICIPWFRPVGSTRLNRTPI